MPKNHLKISVYIIIGLCILIYANTLTNDYSFDDEYVIVNNKKVEQGISGISKIFKSRYIESSDQNYGYRPITLASFAIEYSLFGATPAVSHFFNLLLYIVTCLLLYKILRSLFKHSHWFLPFLITILFVVHPIHTEVVNNVKSRDELLCFLFALMALVCAIKYARKQSSLWLVGIFVFMVISLLSKLSSLTFLAIIPLTLYFFENANKKTILKVIGILLLPLLLFKLINTQLIEVTGNRNLLLIENPLFVNGMNFIEKIPMAFYSVFYYIKLLVVPHPLLSYYGYAHLDIVGWNHPYVWLGAIITIPLAVFALWKFRSKSILVYGILFFFITISMYSNLVKPAVGIIAERFAYIPSLGFCIVLGWLLLKIFRVNITTSSEKFPKLNYAFLGIISVLVLASSAKVFSRNQDWKNLVTLLEKDLEIAPKSVKLNMLLANDLFETATVKNLKRKEKDSLLKKSAFYYNQALASYPQHTPAHNNLGVLYNMTGNLQKSQEHFLKASQDENPTAQTFFNLGLSYRASGDNVNAIKSLQKSIALNPKNFEAYFNLMNIYFENGNYSEAMETNLKMFRLFPRKRKSLFSAGQTIAEKEHGANTEFYINLLLQKKLITQKTYASLKNQLDASVIKN